jgi:hypothetical protein
MKKAGFVAAVGEENFLANIDEALDRAEHIVHGEHSAEEK